MSLGEVPGVLQRHVREYEERLRAAAERFKEVADSEALRVKARNEFVQRQASRRSQQLEIVAKHQLLVMAALGRDEGAFRLLNANWSGAPSDWLDVLGEPGYNGTLPRVLRLGDADTGLGAVVPFIGAGHIAFFGDPDASSRLMEALVIQLLATMEPGRIRLSVFDPVNAGKMLSILSRLDPFVRGETPFNNQRAIEDALQYLLDHITMIRTKYLRGVFPTFEDFVRNEKDSKEPYRLLVISNFPGDFSETAVQRLRRLAENGPEVGINIMLTYDKSQKVPHGLDLDAFWNLFARVTLRADGRADYESAAMPEAAESTTDNAASSRRGGER